VRCGGRSSGKKDVGLLDRMTAYFIKGGGVPDKLGRGEKEGERKPAMLTGPIIHPLLAE